jgi:4-hydroxybenzoate polyprenyltransferase
LGAVIFKKDNIYEIVNNLPELSVMGVSLIFAVVFAVANNNIYDIEIDKISNKDRPLIEGKVDINIYKKIM